MKFKNYLKYLMIIIVLGLIAVSIVLTIHKKEASKTIAEEQKAMEESEIAKEDSEKEQAEEVEGEKKNYYISSSVNFQNYSFICPDGWNLLEEDNGSRVLIRNNSFGGAPVESILVLVEPLTNIKSINDPEEIIDRYMEVTNDLEDAEPLERETIYVDDIKTDLAGYKYNTLLDENTEEVDLISYVEKNGYIYVIKYMGSNIGLAEARDSYRSFVSTFSFDEDVKQVKKDDKNSSVNILILGDDSAFDRPGGRVSGRTDIIILLHINLETYQGTMVTIPRDTWVNIPGYGEGKINGAHAIGGIDLTIKTIEEFSGIDIDNYIITDFDGFVPLIDFLGGVTVEITENLADGFSGCYLSKGVHHLNGEETLALCRNRHREGGAYAREKESAKVILALYEQNSSIERILKLPAFVNFLLKYTWTDFKFVDILKLLPALGKIHSQDIEIKTIPSWPQMVGNASAVVYDEEATRQLFEEIKNQ